jgi:FlaA1/EpsC-like NDP-sugar epimerase
MTIPEACSLVLKAGGVGENGNLYLLDMGEPVWIREMAEQMIRFYGFEPERDIKIEYVGLRPGERLDERLWAQDETPSATEFNRILKVERETPSAVDVPGLLKKLKPVCRFDPDRPDQYRNTENLLEILGSAFPSLRTVKSPKTAAGVYGN